MVTTVLGIDPGGTTGIALLRRLSICGSPGHYRVTPYQYATEDLSPADLVELIGYWTEGDSDGKLFVACEGFVIGRASMRGQRAGGQRARDLIGAVTALPNPVTVRTAATVKPWATDKRLDVAFGLVFRGMPHAKDAARHALYAAVHDLGWPDPLSARE